MLQVIFLKLNEVLGLGGVLILVVITFFLGVASYYIREKKYPLVNDIGFLFVGIVFVLAMIGFAYIDCKYIPNTPHQAVGVFDTKTK